MASATSGSINLSVAVEVLADADNFDTDAGSSFDTANASGAISVPATTAGRTKTFDITLTNNDGTAAEAQIKNGDGTAVITGLTVGTGGADIILDSVSITTGQTVTLTTGTITHA